MANLYNSQLDAFSLYHKNQESSSDSLIGPGLPALGHALAGSTGTAISNLAIYPLDLIITRLQVQRSLRKSVTEPEEGEYKGVLDAFSQIYSKEGGVSAFYSGVLQDTGKSIADSFLFFLFYNYLRSNRLQKHGKNTTTLPVLDELTVGALAGACSKFFTTPISNIVTRKQTSSLIAARTSSSSSEPSVAEIAQKIREEKGVQGFWSGYSASLVLTLNPSITFFLYEFFKRTLIKRENRDDPGARMTFLMAAVSKAIASTITYPFSLAKSRAQTASSPPVDSSSASEMKDEFKNVHSTGDAQEAGKTVKKFTKQNTVFNTILHIYRSEGPAALYEGVFGEILKGFFSHGITMIVKEAIHKVIIQSYYLILKALNKFPTPAELAKQAEERVKIGTERAGNMVKEGYAGGKSAVEGAVESGKEIAGVASERASVLSTNATEVAKNAYESGKDMAGEAGVRAGVVSNNATETAKTINDYAAKDAGHLLGNAREMLGDKIQDVGRGIKVKSDE